MDYFVDFILAFFVIIILSIMNLLIRSLFLLSDSSIDKYAKKMHVIRTEQLDKKFKFNHLMFAVWYSIPMIVSIKIKQSFNKMRGE